MNTFRTEEEQLDAIKRWWRENGISTAVGVVLALGAVFGWRGWQDHQQNRAAEASAVFQQLLEADAAYQRDGTRKLAALELADTLRDDFAGHSSTWVEPLRGDYLGHSFLVMPPNTQGVAQLSLMEMSKSHPIGSLGHNSAEYLHTLIELKKLAFADRDRWIAEQVGPVAREKGLLFVGLDIIGDSLTEINVTSPTCIREIDDQCGTDIGGQLMDCIAAKLKQK